MLQFLANEWLDASMLHWCEMYLYTLQKEATRDTKSHLSMPKKLPVKSATQILRVLKEHLVQVYKHHHNKMCFLASFYYSTHWVFIISPAEHKYWILDSISVVGKKNKSDYPLSKVVEASFGNAFN